VCGDRNIVGPIQWFALVPSTLENIGRRGCCESGDTLSRLFPHCIDGKKMWGKKMGHARKEVGVAIARDPIFIFLPDIFLPSKRSLIALEDARQVLPTDDTD
jgi:hypothetical protein